MKTAAVILSGCGVYDGSEIHEATLTLVALDRANAKVLCAAPDIPQARVVNHLTGQPVEGEQRNALLEAARIARGNIIPLSELKEEAVDAAILPGGFGAAINLCNFAEAGENCTVLPELENFLRAMHAADKPLGFICIAPTIAARVFGPQGVEVTIGNDPETAAKIEAMGAKHIHCTVHNAIVDRRHKIVSTPAYMLAKRIAEAEAGIQKLVQHVLELA